MAETHGPDVESKDASESLPSRRHFIKGLPIAALGAAVLSAGAKEKSSVSSIPSIQIPKDFMASLSAPVRMGSFAGDGQTGGEIFAGLCKEENLAALFCAPGNYAITHAIAEAGIPSYGGRTEGGMALAADGFSRVTGEVVACSGTEGPGITHMVQAIYTAAVAHTPLLVLASNMSLAQDDSHSFIQSLGDGQQKITDGLRKYGKRITAPERLREYGGYAFRELKSGVPGPVHLDFPTEVAAARFKSAAKLTASYDKSRYRSESRAAPSAKDIARAVDLISKAERPLIIAGQGIFQRKAWEPLLAFAEMNECGVCATGPVRGHFPDDHRLSLNCAPRAVPSADLVIFVGQYLMPVPSDWTLQPDVKAIRVHPFQEDLGRNWPLDLGIVSDELEFLNALVNAAPKRTRPRWASEIADARKKFQEEKLDGYYAQGLKYSQSTNRLHPAVVGRELYNFFYTGKIDPKQTVMNWGSFTSQIYVPQYMRANRPGQSVISYYQSGTVGSELNHAIGIAAAVKEGVGPQRAYKGAPIVAYASDASLAYSFMELDTAAKYRLPLILIVYNNDAWGTWIIAAGDSPRALQLHLFQENLRYDRAAEALGCNGAYARTPEEFRVALAQAYDLAAKQSLPTLINVQGLKDFSSPAKYPPGVGLVPGPNIMSFDH